MKIAVIGATGTIGKAVSQLLEEKGHKIVRSSRKITPSVNIDKPESIDGFYEAVGDLDAVICAAGNASFGPLQKMSDKQFNISIQSKLMGQVNLVRKGLKHLGDDTVFVLTSGMLSSKPWPNTSSVAMVNAGLEGFTRAAALDLPEGNRICVVSPPLINETAKKMGRDPEPWPAASVVAEAYLNAVTGDANGEVVYVDGYEM